ncbi:MAG TPA: complex I NDUFA9 subunit family protein [Tepidiformaceae bacterium]|nr:complex I NDUFA9 subunit family protein [Tepidiformaceae bacterium]
MNVVVAGGTGLLGREITKALLDAGHQVTVVSRSNPQNDPIDPRAAWVRADVTDPDTLVAALNGAEVLVDAVQFPNSPIENPRKGYTFERIDLGGTKNLVDAAGAAGVGHFILISGAGAAEDGQYHWLRYKWQEEQHLKASGLGYTIIRPSWIYGPRDVSLNRFLGFAKFLPFIPVIGNGKTRINPLFVGDLAAHVAATPGNAATLGRTFEIGGPTVMTMDEVIRTALNAAGKRRFLLHNPKFLMKFIASVIQYAPGRPLTPDAIDFITMDGIADTTELQEVYGMRIHSLEDALKTYIG